MIVRKRLSDEQWARLVEAREARKAEGKAEIPWRAQLPTRIRFGEATAKEDLLDNPEK